MFNFFQKKAKTTKSTDSNKLANIRPNPTYKETLNIPFQNYDCLSANQKSSEYTNHLGYKHVQYKSRSYKGEGIEAKDVACHLGIVYLSSDNPNVQLINKVLESIDYGRHITGTRISTIRTSNNGGSGTRNYDAPMFSEDILPIIKEELNTESEAYGNYYIYKGKKFKLY